MPADIGALGFSLPAVVNPKPVRGIARNGRFVGPVAEDYPSLIADWVSATIPVLETALQTGELSKLLEQPEVGEVLGPELLREYNALKPGNVEHTSGRQSHAREHVTGC